MRLPSFATALALALAACGRSEQVDSYDQDLLDYIELQHELEGTRTEFAHANAVDLTAVGLRVFWKTFETADARLHSATATGAAVHYGFSIGANDEDNFRAKNDLIVTAVRGAQEITYRAYRAEQPNQLFGQVTFPVPTDNQRWWAYATDGHDVYVITTGSVTTLYRWTPGQPLPMVVTTLEASGATIGEFWDFDVQEDLLVFIESGRLWSMSLSTKTSTWLGNTTEITGAVNFAPDGVAYEDNQGLQFYGTDARVTRDLSEEIRSVGFVLNDSFSQGHYFYDATTHEDFTRYRNWIVYTCNYGMCGYNLRTKSIVPVLLEPEDDTEVIEYRYPVVLDDGTGFVTGLIGPRAKVYQLSLSQLLPK